ncbi:MAG: AarF/ABC1/UbiB kinase family protein [Pontixanthobacter sp.]
MSDNEKPSRYRAVPSSRISRLSGFGRLAGGIAGGMMAEGVRRLASGELPKMQDMLLTPGNALRLADRLSHLRGAAMKLGQMISMDAGDLLPPELSNILAGLRDRANFMPPHQLNQMLTSQWGENWRAQFAHFEPRPIAAASIGQVHRATLHNGSLLAIKVQYPGIRESIDADVDNVAGLLRMSTMLPPQLDLKPILEAAKIQLHEEADYLREGAHLQHYGKMLRGDEGFVVPKLHEELTRDRIIAMSYEPGVPIESLESEQQALRNDVTARLIDLVSRELFEFGMMQTDPNFANYRYQPDTGRIVLLDFGATRPVMPDIQQSYRALIESGLSGNTKAVIQASVEAGFVNPEAIKRHRSSVEFMTQVIIDEFTRDGPFDFGDRAFVSVLRDEGMRIAADRAAWHVPPAETLFVQRKVSGTAMLGARLKAVVDVRAILTARLSPKA